MVKDIYAINESYSKVAKIEVHPGTVGLRASINNTERQSLLSNGVKSPNNYTPGGPVAGESNETRSKAQKEIATILSRLTKQASEARYDKMAIDCKLLKDLIDQVA
jgi:hypothetical protein